MSTEAPKPSSQETKDLDQVSKVLASDIAADDRKDQLFSEYKPLFKDYTLAGMWGSMDSDKWETLSEEAKSELLGKFAKLMDAIQTYGRYFSVGSGGAVSKRKTEQVKQSELNREIAHNEVIHGLNTLAKAMKKHSLDDSWREDDTIKGEDPKVERRKINEWVTQVLG